MAQSPTSYAAGRPSGPLADLAVLPAAWACAGWLAGIALSASLQASTLAWLLVAALAVVAAWAWRRAALRFAATAGSLRLRLLVALLALGLGGAWYQVRLPRAEPSWVAWYNGTGPVTLEGVVVDEPDVRDSVRLLRLRADQLQPADAQSPRPVHGLVLVYAPRFPRYGYGDRLRLHGALETPPEDDQFSYADYLARQGVYSLLRRPTVTPLGSGQANAFFQILFNFKARALEVAAALFPEPQASLISGILLGSDSGIPKRLQDAFQVTGTSHLVAISGFNISIVAGALAASAKRALGPRRALPVVLVGVAVYTLLVGADAPVVRAAIMGALALVGAGLGRAPLGLNLLALAAIGMTAVNPLTLWDVGFQLSVLATLGLIVYTDRFTSTFEAVVGRFRAPSRPPIEWIRPLLTDVVWVTLAAQVTTLPLIAYHFGRVSLVSLLANALVLPAQPGLMGLGGAALLLGVVWLPVGRIAAWLAWPFAAYTTSLVEAFARWPAASLELDPLSPYALWAAYAILFGLTWVADRPAETRPAWWHALVTKWWRPASLLALTASTLLTWQLVLDRPDGRLHVTFLDVGDGDAILVETPTGRRVLIDGGPSPSRLGDALGRRLPIWNRHIDWVVIASPGEAHVAAIADVLGRYPVRSALVAGEASQKAGYRSMLEALLANDVPITSAQAGQRLSLGNGALLEVLAVTDAGAVLRLSHGRASVLLPIGMDLNAQAALLTARQVGPASGLLLANHDSRWINSAEWIQTTQPLVLVLSASAPRAAEVLAPEVQQVLAGHSLLRTDRNGWIELVTDGVGLWVRVERE